MFRIATAKKPAIQEVTILLNVELSVFLYGYYLLYLKHSLIEVTLQNIKLKYNIHLSKNFEPYLLFN